MKRKSKISILFTVLMCVIMLFASTLFTACNDGADSSSASSDTNESSAPEMIEHREQDESVQEVADAAQEQDIASLTFEGTGKAGGNLVGTTYSLSGAFDITDQSGDFSFAEKLSSSSKNTYSYAFLRDQSLFTLSDQEKAVTTWDENVTFSYTSADGALDSVSEMAGIDESVLTMVESYVPLMLSGSVSSVNSAILSFGNFTNAATKTDSAVTIDLTKAFSTFASDLKALVNRIDDDSTVESFLKDVVVADYMNYLTEDWDINDITTLKGGISLLIKDGKLGEYIGNEDFTLDEETSTLILAFLALSPDRNSTAYEYLTKLLCSDELSALLTYFVQSQGEDASEVEIDIADIAIKDILTTLGTTKEDILTALDHVDEDGITLTVTGENADYKIAVTDMKCVFNLNDDKTISDLDVTGTIKVDDMPVTISAKIAYSDQSTTLTDISSCKVSVPHAIYNNGTRTETLTLTIDEDTLTLNPVFANNALSQFVIIVNGENGQSLNGVYNSEEGTLTFTFNQKEYVYLVKQQEVLSDENDLLLIMLYSQDDPANSGDVTYIKADSIETNISTVKDFLAA